MRAFYQAYTDSLETLAEAMSIGWTQNVVILEGCKTAEEQLWYIKAVRQFGWSKLELQQEIQEKAHQHTALDFSNAVCYTEKKASEEGNCHAQPDYSQCYGTGKPGAENRLSPLLRPCYSAVLHRGVHAKPILICGRRRGSLGVADGTGPPGHGGLRLRSILLFNQIREKRLMQ